MRRADVVPLYVIADADALAGRDVADAVAAMAQAGVRWIQLRAKQWPDDQLFRAAELCARALEGTESLLWINDRADLATLLGAGGLHLGQHDLPPTAARKVVGDDVLIGRSTHDAVQMREAAVAPAVDIVAVGPVFPTSSKENPDPTVGLELVREARDTTEKPIVAIGGIDAERAPSVLEAGADAVAVISAICAARDLEKACQSFLGRLSG